MNYIIKSGDYPGEVFFKDILIFINYVIKVMHKDHLYKIKNVSVKVSLMANLVINFVYQILYTIIQTSFNRIQKIIVVQNQLLISFGTTLMYKILLVVNPIENMNS